MGRSLGLTVVLIGLLQTCCGNRPARVVIGVAVTRGNHAAIELAAREINAAGGVRGVKVELAGLEWQVEDQAPALEILNWANRFAENQRLVAVIGHSDSASTLSAAAVYNQRHVPQIVTIATNPAITNIGNWTYRLCLSDTIQGPALAHHAVREWNKRRIAVFHVNDSYGKGLSELFERQVRELGAEIVASTFHRNILRADDKELIRLTLNRLKTAKPDLIALFQQIDAAAWTIRAIREAGIHADILGGDSLSSISFAADNSPFTENMHVSQFFVPNLEDWRTADFCRNLKNTGANPDYALALAYDAVYVLRDAILNGGYTREGVKSYLDQLIAKGTVIDGVGGAYSFGTDHDARRPLYIVEVKNGSHQLINTLQTASR